MNACPIPKYKAGDTAWISRITSTTKEFPCPDCHGSRKWKVIAASGIEHEISCFRCCYNHGTRELVSLKYEAWTGYAELVHLAQIRIEWPSHEYNTLKGPISYCSGIGGGSIYYEKDLYDTKEEAETIAKIKAEEENTKIRTKPEVLQKQYFSNLTLNRATFQAANDAIWEGWNAFRCLRDTVEEVIANDTSDTAEALRDVFKYQGEYNTIEVGLLVQALVRASINDISLEEIKEILNKIPKIKRLCEDKEKLCGD